MARWIRDGGDPLPLDDDLGDEVPPGYWERLEGYLATRAPCALEDDDDEPELLW